ncbi:MAG: alkaline phosphatase D family protein [Candidatus Rokuibacteriota bacterium]
MRLAVALLAVLFAAPASAADPLLVATGDVTATTAIVWARPPRVGDVRIAYEPAGEPAAGRTAVRRATPDTDLTVRVRLETLRPRTRYVYRVAGGGATGEGEFTTAPAPDERAAVRFLWSGDLGSARNCRRVSGGYPIFRVMARHRPDFFLFVGDTIYADHLCSGPEFVPGASSVALTLDGYRAKHRYNRGDDAYGAFLRRTPVSAIWDDHEVRNNFSGPSDPLMADGRRAFLEYFPIQPPDEEPGRLYRRLRWGALLEVFILDTRQYRSPNGQPDGPGKTMLGAAQRRWLLDGLTASTATWKVVVSSVSFSVPTGRSARDSWSNATVWGIPEENGTGFATERDAILRTVRERSVKNLVVLSADVHHAELIRHHPTHDFSFHEFIAGPLAASLGRPRPLDAGLNPRSLFARGGVRNFGKVVVEPSHLTVSVVDEAGAVLFTHTIGPE